MKLPTRQEAVEYFSNHSLGVILTEYEMNECSVIVIVEQHTERTRISQIWEYKNPWGTDDDKYARWYSGHIERARK